MSVSPIPASNMIKPISVGLNARLKVTSTTGSSKPSLTYAGLTGRVLVGENVVVGNVLYPVRSVGAMEWKKIDADAIATMPGLAYVLEAASDGSYALVMFDGFVHNTAEDFGVHATGTITLETKPTTGDTITIGERVYEFVDALSELAADTNVPVLIGDAVGDSQDALKAAIDGDTAAEVTTGTWSSDDLVCTAKLKGTEGSLVAFIADLADATDDCNGSGNLGGTTEGSEGGLLYASTTAGGLQLAAPNANPDVVQQCGFAVSAEHFFFRPSLCYSVVPE